MKRIDTNKMVKGFFEDGQLPALSYIYYHKSEDDAIVRPLHKHQNICEIILICEGECIYYQGEQPFVCGPGTVICTNQDELHELNSSENASSSWYCIGITSLRKVGLPKNHLINYNEPCFLHAGEYLQHLKNIMMTMYDFLGHCDENDLLVQFMCTSLVLIVDRIWRERDSTNRKEGNQNISKRIVDFLNEHYTDENISIADVAKAMNCSETHVSHLFKRVSGQTPKQYIIRRRIGRAQTLLISTDLSITEIASEVGYNNTNYFSTIFADYTGVTPGKYRKIYKEKAKGSYYQL